MRRARGLLLLLLLAALGAAPSASAAGPVTGRLGRVGSWLVDNQGRLKTADRDRVPAWLRMPADTAARKIVTAIAHRRREVVITAHGKAVVFVARHLPGLMSALVSLSRYRGRAEPGRS